MGSETPSDGADRGHRHDFLENGWCRFAADPALAEWVRRTLAAARAAVRAPENAEWLRCGGTWFAGVNVLPNDRFGAVPEGPRLAGAAVDFIHEDLGLAGFSWDRGQVSVCYPGYPEPMASETSAAFEYRRKCDAAHIDGLRRIGPDSRRFLREHHGFILGIPMSDSQNGASPLVVWQGSHEIARETFRSEFGDAPPETWGDIDITEAYHALRRRIFAHCTRVEVEARPGEAYLIHRLALHGIAPWAQRARAGEDGRMVAYFRPETSGPREWLEAP